jgi:hypothetical protein
MSSLDSQRRRETMRKRLTYFAIVASVAATLTIVSCAPDSPSSAASITDPQVAQQKLQDLQNTYGWIGKYHTDGLAYMYTQLTRDNGRKSHADLCRIAAKAVKDFNRSARHRDIPAGLVDPALVSEVCPGNSNGVSATILTGPGSNAKPRHELSSAAQNYINQIIDLANTATTRDAYVGGIQSIENQAVWLPADEAGAVVGVASVALSSLDYWEANLSAWVSIPGTIATAYSISPLDMSAATLNSVGAPSLTPRNSGSWWQNAYVRGFGKVLAADGMAAARTIYLAWEMGPICWDAAAAAALWGSGTTALSLLF